MLPSCVRQLCWHMTLIPCPSSNITIIYLEYPFSFTLSSCDLGVMVPLTPITSTIIYTFKLIFYFEIILDLHAIMKNNTEISHKFLTQYPPMITFCKTMVQYQNVKLDTDIGKISNISFTTRIPHIAL